MSQRPIIFFKNVVLPSYPPSFVMLYFSDFSLIIGLSNSVPINDHVPQLKKIKSFSCAGTESKALCVSWEATATTLTLLTPSSSHIVSLSCPTIVPLGTISVNISLGISKAFITFSDQFLLFASIN